MLKIERRERSERTTAYSSSRALFVDDVPRILRANEPNVPWLRSRDSREDVTIAAEVNSA